MDDYIGRVVVVLKPGLAESTLSFASAKLSAKPASANLHRSRHPNMAEVSDFLKAPTRKRSDAAAVANPIRSPSTMLHASASAGTSN